MTEQEERRRALRREDDLAAKEIADGAVEVAPLVGRLLKTGKVLSAAAPLFMAVGVLAALLGVRLIGPPADIAALSKTFTARADTNAARIARQDARFDSLITVMLQMRNDIQTSTFIQCVELRRNNPDLRPPGCDAAGLRPTP